MQRVVSLAMQIAKSDVPVLITGPNGAGKEKIAEIIHANSSRQGAPFVKVNAGALPEQLLESELFGAEAGAYTGSSRLRIGRFETANGGTLFLDEIGESAAGRTGEAPARPAERRIRAPRIESDAARRRARPVRDERRSAGATRARRVPAGSVLPAQRDRDRGAAAQQAARRHPPARRTFLGGKKKLDDDARTALLAYDWPGNVRELQNRITRATLISTGDSITREDLGFDTAGREPRDVPVEKHEIEIALLDAGGSVSRAAEALGVSRQALYRRMEKLGIVLERKPRSE